MNWIGLRVCKVKSDSSQQNDLTDNKRPKKLLNLEEVPSFIHRFTSTYFAPSQRNLSREKDSQVNSLSGHDPTYKLSHHSSQLKRSKNRRMLSTANPKSTNSALQLSDQDDSMLKRSSGNKPQTANYSNENSVDNSVNRDHRVDENQLDESTTLCNVCFAEDADAIFMKCGHGGLCLKCSYDIWKTTDECYLCRQTVDYVLKYDVRDKRGESYRVVEIHQQL